MTDHSYQWPPLQMQDDAQHRYKLAHAIRHLKDGRHEAHGTVTLTANAASTALNDARIGGNSVVTLSPKTANAAAAVATTYIATYADGSCTITHANNAQTDKAFLYSISG